MSPLVVYISGPCTLPDPVEGIRNAVKAAERVRELGGMPIVPHLSHLWYLISPHSHDYWLDMDLELVALADVVWRLPGYSGGADAEVARAEKLGIPVVYYFEDDLVAMLKQSGHHLMGMTDDDPAWAGGETNDHKRYFYYRVRGN